MKNNYTVEGDVAYVEMSRRDGVVVRTMVSADSLDKLMRLDAKWRVHYSGHKEYATTNIVIDGKKTTIKLHRFLTDCPQDLVVDHINGDTLDNRLENLRICTQGENSQNRTGLNKNNTSGVRGVTWSKQHGKWKVSVMVNRKRKHIGLFADIEEAKKAAESARERYFTHAD